MDAQPLVLRHKSVSQGPAADRWETMKPHIFRLYIEECLPLRTIIEKMAEEHNFKATTKMYNSHFQKWGPEFDKNRKKGRSADDAPKPPTRGKRTRPRRMQTTTTTLVTSSSSSAPGTPALGSSTSLYPLGLTPPDSPTPDAGADADTDVPADVAWVLARRSEPPPSLVPLQAFLLHTPEPPTRFLHLELTLQSINDYTSVVFSPRSAGGHWTCDRFRVVPPPGTPDHAATWQLLADQCFGGTTLIAGGSVREGLRTLDAVNETLRRVARFADPAVMVKFWRICLRLHKAHRHLGDLQLLHAFLRYFRSLVHIYHPPGHPLVRLLDALVGISDEDLYSTMQVAYLRSIRALEAQLGDTHPVVLHMWSNYLKNWKDTSMVGEDGNATFVARYWRLVAAAEEAYGPSGDGTIAVLHEFLYAAYYNVHDPFLSATLATELLSRAAMLPCLLGSPAWTKSTHAYALAAKLLAILRLEDGRTTEAWAAMEEAILRLSAGDRECRTRALMLAGLFQSWLLERGEAERAATWRTWRENLLEGIGGNGDEAVPP